MSNKKNNIAERTCIGCKVVTDKRQLIRIAYYEGKLSVDNTGKAKGRGAYLCQCKECFDKAIKSRAFNRAFKTNLENEVLEEIRSQIE